MDYLWLKALHITAVMTWIGGILVTAVTLTALPAARDRHEAAFWSALLGHVRRWDRRVTTPAMLLTWALGLALALTGHWFPQRWLAIKLSLVLLLSALHGVLSGSLRRLSRSDSTGVPAHFRYAAAAVVLAVFIIVLLVVLKPL
jgi:uncharacterized integral membrane protein (TIGR00701 family)